MCSRLPLSPERESADEHAATGRGRGRWRCAGAALGRGVENLQLAPPAAGAYDSQGGYEERFYCVNTLLESE
ncbi:hypothetical protein EVAR_33102_1 [Eumeta japonica]|uniref:Uncharacterized protein n=1 Tax=Eumeta variegata TaxID=151549 RepID=A0A4C1Y836_EUMVA|nr:hypothetical protein EVAR_33102_1 [Eumeta japonica]